MGVVVPYGGNLVGVGKECEFMGSESDTVGTASNSASSKP